LKTIKMVSKTSAIQNIPNRIPSMNFLKWLITNLLMNIWLTC
jgi:hypothetical protein